MGTQIFARPNFENSMEYLATHVFLFQNNSACYFLMFDNIRSSGI